MKNAELFNTEVSPDKGDIETMIESFSFIDGAHPEKLKSKFEFAGIESVV